MLLCCVIDDSSQPKKRIVRWIRNHKTRVEKILKQFHRNRQNQSSTRKMLCGIARIFFQQMQQCCREREERKLIQPWKISFFCMTTTSLLVEGATTLIVQFSVHLLFLFSILFLYPQPQCCVVCCCHHKSLSRVTRVWCAAMPILSNWINFSISLVCPHHGNRAVAVAIVVMNSRAFQLREEVQRETNEKWIIPVQISRW